MKKLSAILLSLIMVLSICALSGCGDKAEPEADTEHTVTEEEYISEVTIELSADMSDGNSWMVVQKDKEGNELQCFDVIAEMNENEDGTGTQTFTLTSVMSGNVFVTFIYGPSWNEDEAVATGTYKFRVKDDMNIIQEGIVKTTGDFEALQPVKG